MSLSLHWEKNLTDDKQATWREGLFSRDLTYFFGLLILEYFILILNIQFVNNAHELWKYLVIFRISCHIIIGSIKSSHFMTDCEKKLWWETHKLLFACSIHFVLCLVHFIHTYYNVEVRQTCGGQLMVVAKLPPTQIFNL